MRTISIKLYSFNELSGASQKRALRNYSQAMKRHHVYDEGRECIQAFEDAFPASSRWGVNWLDLGFDGSENVEALKGLRLRTYLLNNFGEILYKPKFIYTDTIGSPRIITGHSKIQKSNSCVLTGIIWDDSLLAPIYEFIEQYERSKHDNMDFDALIRACCTSLENALDGEADRLNSDEAKREAILEDGCEFTEDGELYQ